MNRSILRTFAKLSLSAALGSLSLLAQNPLRATVPFDFTVGSKSFAAGEYSLRQVAHMVLQIQSADGGRANVMIATLPGESTKVPGSAKLVFNRYGDRYFLSEVSADSGGWQVPKSVDEKELIAKGLGPKPPVVVASGPKK
jgi:hypothetical protein